MTLPKKAPAEVVPTRVAVSTDAVMSDDDSDDDEASRPYTLTVVAAGIAAADVEVLAKPGLLKVEGATARTGAKVSKCFRLPRDADVARATAIHVDGILTVTVPKQPAPVAKRVDVQTSIAGAAEEEDGVMV